MIANRAPAEPEQKGPALWVALLFIHKLAEWRAIGEYESWYDAARACLRALMPDWHAIAEQARTLRALLTHPAIAEFSHEIMDGPMLVSAGCQLSDAIAALHDNLERLLESPKPDDPVRIHGAEYRASPVDGALILRNVPFAARLPNRADVELLKAIERSLSEIGTDITGEGVDLAIYSLLMAHPDERGRTDDSIEQAIADRLFARILATTVQRVYQRTGALPTDEGLDNGAMAAYLVRDTMAGSISSDTTGESLADIIAFQRPDDDEKGPSGEGDGPEGEDDT